MEYGQNHSTIEVETTNSPDRIIILLAIEIILAGLLAAFGSTTATLVSIRNTDNQAIPATKKAMSQNSSAAVGNALPGTEEFGMTKEELVKSIEAVEVNISACMRETGFEYIAVDYKTARQGMVADKSLPCVSEKQFANQYGYGISTLYTGLDP